MNTNASPTCTLPLPYNLIIIILSFPNYHRYTNPRMTDDLAIINTPSPAAAAATTQPPSSRSLPFREDCWTEDATSTLVDAWGRRYLELNRGNLRQKDWQVVADAVNCRHGHTKKTRRTDVQCKNRIDTLKKKYKSEKARVSVSGSNWPFFPKLDVLIGTAASAKKSSSPSPPSAVPLPNRKPPSPATAILPQKRPTLTASYFRRNYSAVAAAAAAEVEGSDEDESPASSDGVRVRVRVRDRKPEADNINRLSRAIEQFGEIYERVEGEKQKQMIELEKQRMQFTKDLEVQRMQLFMDTQVQLEKIKQAKRTAVCDEEEEDEDDVYS